MTYIITAALALLAAVILAALVAVIARSEGPADPPGADEAYADELHAAAEMTAEMPAVPEVGGYRSRHHEDTVEWVPDVYRPLYSPAFAAVMGYDRRESVPA